LDGGFAKVPPVSGNKDVGRKRLKGPSSGMANRVRLIEKEKGKKGKREKGKKGKREQGNKGIRE